MPVFGGKDVTQTGCRVHPVFGGCEGDRVLAFAAGAREGGGKAEEGLADVEAFARAEGEASGVDDGALGRAALGHIVGNCVGSWHGRCGRGRC